MRPVLLRPGVGRAGGPVGVERGVDPHAGVLAAGRALGGGCREGREGGRGDGLRACGLLRGLSAVVVETVLPAAERRALRDAEEDLIRGEGFGLVHQDDRFRLLAGGDKCEGQEERYVLSFHCVNWWIWGGRAYGDGCAARLSIRGRWCCLRPFPKGGASR